MTRHEFNIAFAEEVASVAYRLAMAMATGETSLASTNFNLSIQMADESLLEIAGSLVIAFGEDSAAQVESALRTTMAGSEPLDLSEN